MQTRTIGFSLFATLALWSAVALAQSPVGALAGTAKAGDVALIRNVATGFTREVKVGKSGRYQLRNLSPGTFEVIIRHPGGATDAPRKVDVHLGMTTRVQ